MLLLLRFSHHCLQWRHWPLHAKPNFHDRGWNLHFPVSIKSSGKSNIPDYFLSRGLSETPVALNAVCTAEDGTCVSHVLEANMPLLVGRLLESEGSESWGTLSLVWVIVCTEKWCFALSPRIMKEICMTLVQMNHMCCFFVPVAQIFRPIIRFVVEFKKKMCFL